jgi:23S rRNA (uracil747-C5)-methyltransferase
VELSTWLEQSCVPTVVYSSCNPKSLAHDLARMPSYSIRTGRVLDMFPQTGHMEVAVLLERR